MLNVPPPPLQTPTPPTAESTSPAVPVAPYIVATTGQRFANWFIDGVLVWALLRTSGDLYLWWHFGIWNFLMPFILFFAYIFILESTTGKTIGKFFTRTRVVTINGSKPDLGQILQRTIIRFIPFEPFSFLGSARPSGWHDKWSNTVVIEDKSAKY